MLGTAVHVGYMDFGSFEKHIDRVRQHMRWPRILPGSYKEALRVRTHT
jgi:hypothetical protein